MVPSPKIEKREAILNAALELIAKEGLQNAPISAISKYSKASPGIIYHYFVSKDELVRTLYEQIYRQSFDTVRGADDPAAPPIQRFRTLWLAVYRYCHNHPLEIAFLDQYENSPLARQQKTPFQAEGLTLDKLLAKLQKEPQLGKLNPGERTLVGLLAALRAGGLIKNLAPAVVAEFTVGVPRRLARQAAAGDIHLTAHAIEEAAQACWDAIAT